MNETDLRMECLRLAVSQNHAWSQMPVPPRDSKSDIDLALEYYTFVKEPRTGGGTTLRVA